MSAGFDDYIGVAYTSYKKSVSLNNLFNLPV